MKVSCDAAELAAALAVVSRALAARTTLPILGTVLLEANGDGLTLSATNLELGIRKAIEADVAAGGAIAAPGRLLTDFASAITDERLDLELRTPGPHLRLRSASYETEILGADPDEFPPAPTAAGGEVVAVAAGDLVSAIADTVVAASSDEARPILTGVRISAGGTGLTLTATDGYRLAEQSVPVVRAGTLTATVPARALAEVARLFRSAQGDVEVILTPDRRQVFFNGREGEVSSRVIDGRYPETGRLIPTSWTTRASVDAGELGRRLRALIPFATHSANVVRLAVTADFVELSAAATEVGSASTRLEARVTGADTAFAFNARYLLDCLATADGPIDLELQGALAPALIRRPAAGHYLYLFMPVRYPLS